MTRERKSFSSEFKLQMVRLYESGKPRNEIILEYDLTFDVRKMEKAISKHGYIQSPR
ncbi:TPA: transposase [Staphylococcus aureus]|nr:transposase [Staphylococcus aureus]